MDSGTEITSSVDVSKRWAQQLYARVDGVGLKESGKIPQQHMWIQEGTRFLSRRDFLQSCKLRINAIPTRSRTTRGRLLERQCRTGCGWPETLDHVLQKCHRTHGPRIKRHNAVAAYVARALSRQEYTVAEEPEIRTTLGLRKPDIVAKLGQTVLVIDAQVVNDQMDLDTAHRMKSSIYENIEANIKQMFNVTAVRFTSVTLSWRGVWSEASARDLLSLGVLRPGVLKVI